MNKDTLKKLMKTVFVKNKQMNAAKREHDKARKELNDMMLAHEIKTVDDVTVKDDETNKMVNLSATIESRTTNAVDVQKLRELVTDDEFMQIVTANQAAVKKVVSTNVLNEVLVPQESEPYVKVKQVK